MLRLTRRASLLLVGYVSLLLAVVMAGYLAAAVGIWAAVLWGTAILVGLVIYGRQRLQRVREDE